MMKNHGNGCLCSVDSGSITCDEYCFIDDNKLSSLGPASITNRFVYPFINQLPFPNINEDCVAVYEKFHQQPLIRKQTCFYVQKWLISIFESLFIHQLTTQ